jgi:hypothetical protein
MKLTSWMAECTEALVKDTAMMAGLMCAYTATHWIAVSVFISIIIGLVFSRM